MYVVAHILLISMLMAGSVAAQPEAPMRVELRDELLRAGDLATGVGDSQMVVARLPDGTPAVVLSEDDRRALLRARLPGASFRLRASGPVEFVGGISERAVNEAACFAARADIAAGSFIDQSEVAPVPCERTRPHAGLGYDASARAPLARGAIPAGAYLGPVRAVASDPVAAGETLVLRSAIGPVMVERTVTSMEAARRGGRIFVRTEDGELVSARLDGTAGDRAR